MAENVTTKPSDGVDLLRLSKIAARVLEVVKEYQPDIVGIEGYALSRQTQQTRLGELGGIIKYVLYQSDQPYVVVSPSAVKKFATGKGNADKPMMLTAALEFWPECTSYDTADAIHVARFTHSMQ